MKKYFIPCLMMLSGLSLQANTLVYDFNDGTMQGWTNKMVSSARAGYFDLSFGPAQQTGHDGWGSGTNAAWSVPGVTNNTNGTKWLSASMGAYFLGEIPFQAQTNLTDWTRWPAANSGVQQTIMVESPAFFLDGSGELTLLSCGDNQTYTNGRSILLTTKAAIPTVGGTWGPDSGNPDTTKGNCGVGLLRDDGVFVISTNFSGDSSWVTNSFTAAQLAPYVNDGHTYTLAMVDFWSGRNSWCAIDSVTIPGVLAGLMPRPQMSASINATNNKLALRWGPTLSGKTQSLVCSTNLSRPLTNWTVVSNVTTVDGLTAVEIAKPTNTTMFYCVKTAPVYGKYLTVSSVPANTSAYAGGTALFSVSASGSLLTYQWYKAGQLLSGQTNSALILSNLSTNDAGTYSVVVSGVLGTPVTNSAVLVVNIPGTLTVLDPVKFYNVTLTDPFWSRRISTQVNLTMPQWFTTFMNEGIYNNWAKVGNLMGGNFQGYIFSEIDAAMSLQGMLRANKYVFNPNLDSQLRTVFSYIAADQNVWGTGYINFYVQLGMLGRSGDYNGRTPWSDLISQHEHLVAGDLFWVALDDYELFGRTNMLGVARRLADHMSATFGPSPKTSGIGGHQGCEIPLLKMSELPLWGRPSDYEQAKFYIEERGRHSGGRILYGEYCQDLHELKHETEPYGHAVRGPYHWESAAHLCRTTQDTNLSARLETLWNNLVNKKMYVTGGIGHQLCNEGFSVDYDLDNDKSYCESCANCAMMFWGREMANLLGDGKYSDLVEWELYNSFAAGQSLDGSRIYYRNYVKRTSTSGRLGIQCCMGNVSRTIPDVPGYQYSTRSGDGIWTHLYMAGQGRMTYNATNLTITQTTLYPWDGAVTMTVGVSNALAFTMHLRIPGWCTNATVSVNGQSQDMGQVTKGYLPITRTWQNGDSIALNFPMPIRRIYSHPKVWANLGRVAIARGPVVYCLESPYNSGVTVTNIVIPKTATLTAGSFNTNDLGGIVRITGTGLNAANSQNYSFTLIPYAVWDNANKNDNSVMCVMIPETASAVNTTPDRGRLANATVSYSYVNTGWPAGDNPAALNDGIIADQADQRVL